MDRIPDSWGTPTVGTNFDVQLGKMLSADAVVNGDQFRYLRNTNVQWDRLDLEDVSEMHFDALDRSRYALEPGDLLVCEGGEVGRAAIWQGDIQDCYYQKALHRVRPRVDDSVRFLLYALWAASTMGVFESEGNTSTIVHLTAEKLRAHRFPWPKPAEQRAIADYLDTETARIDAIVAVRQRQRELARARFLEMARRAVTGGMYLRDPLEVRPEDLSEAEWVPVKLGADMRLGSGTTPTAGNERYYGPGVPWIVTGNLRDQRVEDIDGSVTAEALADFSALKVHPAESLVVAMYGATVGRLGITSYPATVNQACCILHSGSKIETMFLYYYLLSHRDVLIQRSVGAGQPNISQQILSGLRVACPPRPTQLNIVAELESSRHQVESLDTALEQQVGLLLERRQALITAAVTGQTEIPGVAA